LRIPAGSFFSEQQQRTLAALCDTLVPALAVEPDPHGYWARNASDLDIPAELAAITRDLTDEVTQRQTRQLLDLLSNPLSACLLTGHFLPFADLTLEQRERVLRGWAASPAGLLRQSFQGLKRTTCALFYSKHGPDGCNPNWPAIGYPGPPGPPAAKPKTLPLRVVGDGDTLDCDAVVVGSGAGGSVVAAELAQAGHDVIVLEKGGYYDEADFDGDEYSGYRRLYENQAVLATRDLAVVVLAGSTLGGGTTINWSACFRTPPQVLEEWEREHYCTEIAGPEFQASLDSVCARLGVTTAESEPNAESLAMMRGCEALGYRCETVPRNVQGCGSPPACGWCGYGCARGAKQSALKTYLRDAAEAGARLLVKAEAQRVLVEQGRATGVEATVDGRAVTVRARAVVVASGAIHTPALLRRSALANPNIGRNLRLHPTSAVYGDYPEPIETWRGVMMARYSGQFADLDGRGYGVRIENPPAHPGLMGLGQGWRSGRQHKQLLARAAHHGIFIVLTRDHDAGRVSVDRAGRPVLHYRLSQYDGAHLKRGLREAFRLHAAAGATEIGGPHAAPEPYRAGEDLDGYLDSLERLALRPNSFVLFSAHQMGTCRMGGLRGHSVVDPRGQSWDVRNLFVADASLFPTASGVNPMITVMALAHRVAQSVKALALRSGP
jgi:choline dehydrogenase-like flavoprotein